MLRILKKLSRLFSSKPHPLSNHERRIYAIETAGDSETALREWDALIERYPNHSKYYVSRARLKRTMGDHSGAIDDCNQGLALDKGDANWKGFVYILRGQCYADQAMYSEALADFDACIRISHRDRLPAYYFRAVAEQAAGSNEQAVDDFTHALSLARTQGDTQFINACLSSRGNSYRRLQNYPAAVQDYDEVIAHDPGDQTAYLGRAVAHLWLDHHELAVADLTHLIEVQSDNPKPYRLRAIALVHKGCHEQALSDAFQALMLAPDEAANYGTLTTCYLALGKHEEALVNALKQEELATAKADKSGIRAARLGQAIIHCDRHEREKALPLWRAIIDDNDDCRDYDSMRSVYYFTPHEAAIVRQLFEETVPQAASTLS